jgi:hypothetical protein
MGRGLSPLQRWILDKAARGRPIRYADVLEGYFGWQAEGPPRTHAEGEQPRFSVDRIGPKRYGKVMATLSRTCWGLHRLGLVHCLCGEGRRCSAIIITAKGNALLSADKLKDGPPLPSTRGSLELALRIAKTIDRYRNEYPEATAEQIEQALTEVGLLIRKSSEKGLTP